MLQSISDLVESVLGLLGFIAGLFEAFLGLLELSTTALPGLVKNWRFVLCLLLGLGLGITFRLMIKVDLSGWLILISSTLLGILLGCIWTYRVRCARP